MDPSSLLMMSVLTQGGEQARQLRAHLNEPSFDIELCKSLAQSIESSFQTAISLAKNGCQIPGSDSPPSGSNLSPRSDTSNQVKKDQEQKEVCKKRKSLPKWSSQVRVSLGGETEGPLDDGYTWRKYGQKDILGAKYPRGYYRCSHRYSQGCLATKLVQRSDEDPSIFNVSCRGTPHTCIEKHHKGNTSQKEQIMKQSLQGIPDHDKQQKLHQLLNLGASLQVKTEGLEAQCSQTITPTPPDSSSFSFPSTPVNCIQPQSNSNTLPTSSQTTFMTANTPESNYYYYSLCPFQMGTNVNNSELDLTEMISATTSATSSPMIDMEFTLAHEDFDPNFHFDNSFF